MEPKEKAKELLDKYYIICQEFTEEIQCSIQAKQCALITVDEMLKESRMFDTEQVKRSNGSYSRSYYEIPNKFWQQVKQEIEKL
jgi:hypothetical protein